MDYIPLCTIFRIVLLIISVAIMSWKYRVNGFYIAVGGWMTFVGAILIIAGVYHLFLVLIWGLFCVYIGYRGLKNRKTPDSTQENPNQDPGP